MMWYCFASIVLTLHTGAYFPTWRLLVSFWFRSILVRESTIGDIIFQFGVQSHYFPEAFRAIIFQFGIQSHYFSEALRAIIFQSQCLELMIDQGFVCHILLHGRL